MTTDSINMGTATRKQIEVWAKATKKGVKLAIQADDSKTVHALSELERHLHLVVFDGLTHKTLKK